MVPNWSPIGPTQSFRGASQGRQLTPCWVDATFALFHLVWLRSSWLLPSSCCMAAVSRGFWEAAAETAARVTQQPGLCGASHKRAGRRGLQDIEALAYWSGRTGAVWSACQFWNVLNGLSLKLRGKRALSLEVECSICMHVRELVVQPLNRMSCTCNCFRALSDYVGTLHLGEHVTFVNVNQRDKSSRSSAIAQGTQNL